MQPEHEQFLISHMEKMGFFFIIDRLKDEFPDLTHQQACDIYEEFRDKHAEDESHKQATAQMQEVGNTLAEELNKALNIKKR